MQQLTPPEQLHQRIVEQIRMQALLRLRRRILLFAWIFGGSAVVFALSLGLFMQQMQGSGFMDLLALAGSDFKTVTANLNDYLLSLIESLPIMSSALLFGVFSLMAASIYKIFEYVLQIKELGAKR